MAAITKTLTINNEKWFASLNGNIFFADNGHIYFNCHIRPEDQYTDGKRDYIKAFKCGANELIENLKTKKELKEWDGVIN